MRYLLLLLIPLGSFANAAGDRKTPAGMRPGPRHNLVSEQPAPVRRDNLVSEQPAPVRRDILIDDGWTSALNGLHWRAVDIPHNWDDYGGYRRLRHGNLHGFALYRRRLSVDKRPGLRYFLWFEGVGSYATVWVNGQKVGYHAGGRTSFTVDITDALSNGHAVNTIDLRADHPAFIRDLPWVCGGCSDERGFSEGSQPLGIFRPVHLVITPPTRIQPFGVHIWNDTTISDKSATLYLETELHNYGTTPAAGVVTQQLLDSKGAIVASVETRQQVAPGQTVTLSQRLRDIAHPHLWSDKDPYLYSLRTVFGGDAVVTSYGIRRIRWPDPHTAGPHPFLLNGRPVFINGIAEYEHRIGNSHAFTAEEIGARVAQIRAAGFNAFRDAHQPHNLRYQHYWDSLGMLWWPQLSAHIWFDTPAFRENFKRCLTEWVKERRNSPSVILWGLQNESRLPEDFARECADLIRRLDPTASSQRLIVTCNGGAGTDWDVPQNWTGTYGGNPATYGADLKKQVLVGEYGAWRTIDLHDGDGGGRLKQEASAGAANTANAASAANAANEANTANPAGGPGLYPEEQMCRILETKIRLADSVKDEVAGHFMWLYSSHDNPGRVQSGEGLREIDRIGPVNYKGLLTSWEEPVDAFYLFRSNYAPAESSPMVYIVSHTWPDRWDSPGIRSGIVVYSNCDSVELFNDVDSLSLGKRGRGGIGTHFEWDDVDIRYNVLYAVGWFHGRPVAHDCIVLHHLPASPHFGRLVEDKGLTAPAPGYRYLYRVNCGGSDYTDHHGDLWMADRHYTGGRTWGSLSWTDDYKGLPAFFASQRWTADPIAGTADWPLFQDFRYGLGKLRYTFPAKEGIYRLELYFAEPWLGAGGGMDCTGWRLFDVAVNGKTVLRGVDIWKEAGRNRALKKTVDVHVTGGNLVISFPHTAAGQAIIDAIAIATTDTGMTPAPPSAPDTAQVRLEPAYDLRPVVTYKGDSTEWQIEVGVGDKYSLTVKYRWLKAAAPARLELRMADGTLLHRETVELRPTLPNKWNYLNATTGSMINAGHYTVRLTVPSREGLRVDQLQIQ
ncbi:MAG TPA: malectin domain-containing carbohydrate-binding protein [Puia sp.]|nr:malectin domain-containing carbohydrate-binding protein [Puia sp.]